MLMSDNNVLSQAALRDYGSGDEMDFTVTENTRLYGMLKKNPLEADYDPDGIRKELYKMFGVNK